MKNAVLLALSALFISDLAAQTDESRELNYNEKSALSLGLVTYGSSDFEGQGIEFQTTLAKFDDSKWLGEKASLYAGGQYATGSHNNATNVSLTESEVYLGLRVNVAGDSWIFIEDGYLQQKHQVGESFTRANSEVTRFGIEDTILKTWLPSKSGEQNGINLRVAIEMYERFEQDYEGYRIDLGYKSPISMYYKNNFSGDESVYGFNFTHVF